MANEREQVTLSYVKRDGKHVFEGMPETKTIPECIEYFARTKSEKEAFVFVSETERTSTTWRELYTNASMTAKSMIRLGVQKDDYIIVHLSDSPQWLYVVFGAMIAGARPVPLYYVDKTWKNVETLLQRLETCSMLIIEERSGREPMQNVFGGVDKDGAIISEKYPYMKRLLCHAPGDGENGHSLPWVLPDTESDVELPTIDEDDIAICFLSSGSTGSAKVLPFTNKQYVWSCRTTYESWQYNRHENFTVYNGRPLAWSGGFPRNYVLGNCRVMCTFEETHPPSEYRVQRLVDTIKNEGCTIIWFAESYVYSLIGRKVPDNWPVKLLRPPGQLLFGDIMSLLGTISPSFIIGYNSTECKQIASYIITKKEDYILHKVGSITQSNPIEVKIVDDNGEIVPLGVHGEIHVRSPITIQGYVNDRKSTELFKDKDGWCRTDDIGMMKKNNDDVDLYVFQRKSNIVKIGLNKIDPELVEKVIEKMNTDITHAYVVPVPEQTGNFALCACVEMKKGCTLDISFMNNEFKRLQDESPSDYKVVPHHWLVIGKVPLLDNGKPARRQLAELAERMLKKLK